MTEFLEGSEKLSVHLPTDNRQSYPYRVEHYELMNGALTIARRTKMSPLWDALGREREVSAPAHVARRLGRCENTCQDKSSQGSGAWLCAEFSCAAVASAVLQGAAVGEVTR